MRRLAIALLAASAAVGFSATSTAFAQSSTTDDTTAAATAELAPVDVLEVSGFVDAIVADEIEQAIERAASNGSQALILQMNTTRSVVSRERMTELATAVSESPVPVAVWVGPSGSHAYGLPGQLVAVAAVSGMAPGSRIGDFGVPLQVGGKTLSFGDESDRLQSETVGAEEARQIGLLKADINDRTVPVLRNMLFALDGLTYGGRTLDTVVQVTDADGAIQNQAATPRFFKLGLFDRLMHTVASVPAAYLLLVIGLGLLVFEFFTAGVGVAGVVGVVCTVLAGFGLASMPLRGWALAVLLASMLALAVDVQVGIPRFWTGVGMLLFTVGSVFLYREGLRLSWLTLVIGVAGTALAFIVGMPSMVRTRFATPTIGREWMIGEMGTAKADVSPEGVVVVREAMWRARTNRATPIKAGEPVRVVAIDGVTLEVEPETGAARDYRERRGKSGAEITALDTEPATAD